MTDHRRQQLASWAGQQLNSDTPELETVSGDASFRRYFRFNTEQGSIIAVDAPPTHENNQAFYRIAQLLKKHALMVPEFLHQDFERGFLLISDLGDQLYLPALNNDSSDRLYRLAIDAIIQMQLIPMHELSDLPRYDETLLMTEMQLFNQWFIHRHLELNLTGQQQAVIDSVFQRLQNSALKQQQCMVHRDYHSRNLMICPSQTPGIIDFQDAVVGPATYDLVSLLKDCYICWPHSKRLQWLEYYRRQAVKAGIEVAESDALEREFDWMGMQRHIKVLGIFCRLYYRDCKDGYLNDLPLTFDYLVEACARYPQFTDFHQLLEQVIRPAMEDKR